MADDESLEPATKVLFQSAIEAGADPHYNACVGENTGSVENAPLYAGGFEKATEVLLVSLGLVPPSNARPMWARGRIEDILVYPICYCARHHVELSIKHLIPLAWTAFKLRHPNDRKGLSKPEIGTKHSIKLYWNMLNDICKATDSRLESLAGALEPYIQDLESVDSTGQVFRYASNSDDDELHLEELDHIDLAHFAQGYAELCKILEDIRYTLMTVEAEAACGSFAGPSGRDTLRKIADELPPLNSWGDGTFNATKASIRLKYSLGSNALSAAINRIKSSRHLSYRVGHEIPIEHLNRGVFERLHRTYSGDHASAASLSEAELSALHAVLEVGNPSVMPEEFDSYLAPRPAGDEAAYQYDLERDPKHLARKFARAPDRIRASLQALGQPTLLSEFTDVYADHIARLEKLRVDQANGFDDFLNGLVGS
ncbi:TPA: hypothetical protein UMV35_000277 [Stenotrophomonas maltophilia]|uniref:hypothetical protein n=1 Tax=Stenotrophomonas TaxID=40323 RepID=UPI00114C908A|nr:MULTISPECIES: hypothetical protein [Stenotrophomonas]MBH1590864.1 hypothetical protein [Stenotrophomonas maltophilia]MDH2021715.1 hypothetical protein [Stenotrophomonas sp. GD03680]HDS1321628.1 hypothetical protein [Stenotrophomonas maltophilia]HDS1326237.1 hypothetical protein [Stenotrophomonas maltophilia]HDS1330943.1 hypothetical protein [Stenotrophomonas maltophilia]